MTVSGNQQPTEPRPSLSVVVPCYGSPGTLVELVERVEAVAETLELAGGLEIVLVNDRCPVGSWAVIEDLHETSDVVTAVNLSRNFGQHYAIFAGLDAARGDWIVVMDCDLQDVPEEIAALHAKALDGYDAVFAARTQREDSFLKRFGSRQFYNVLSWATGTKQDARIANFGIYSRKFIDAVLQFKEQLRFFPTNARWVGFKTTELTVRHSLRAEGKSSYSLSRLLALASNVIFGFSDKPINLLIRVGLVIAAVSILSALLIVIRYFAIGTGVQGWASIMVSLWFMFGIVIFSLGVVGIYIAKAFDESKGRPAYIVDEYKPARRTGPIYEDRT